jgi:hypothetical protein
LRHQLQLLQRAPPRRLRLAKADRWLWVVLSRFWAEWRTALRIVKPETVIAWHQRGFQFFSWSCLLPEPSAGPMFEDGARPVPWQLSKTFSSCRLT